jgi:colicin import membrane protein
MSQAISIFKKVESLVPSTIFQLGGIQPILDAIKKEVSDELPDTSTAKGRDAIRSNASKVSKSKTLLDGMGKALADDLNAKLKPINDERKLARDTLDALRDKTREPLTQYEADEQAKEVAKAEQAEAERLAIVKESDWELALLKDEKFDRDLADLKAKAEAERVELEAKELKELEARNEQIAKDAAEAERAKSAQALIDAEYEKQKAERQVLQQQEDAKNLALKFERDAEAERVRLDKAEKYAAQRLIDLEEANRQQRIADAKKAEEDKLKAVAVESARVVLIARQEKAEIDQRAANKEHCRKLNLEAVECLRHGGLSNENATLAVRLIAAKRVTNIVINY